jgi:hypothetical protein
MQLLYVSYRNGDLQPNENLWAGLSLSLETLEILQDRIVTGLPAMRLEVALAQVREMNAALYGPTSGKALVRPTVSRSAPRRQAEAATGSAPVSGEESQSPSSDRRQPSRAPNNDKPPEGTHRHLLSVGTEIWAGLPFSARLVAGIGACLATAALIDLPFAMMALLPGLIIPIAAVLIGVPVAVGVVRRHRSTLGR